MPAPHMTRSAAGTAHACDAVQNQQHRRPGGDAARRLRAAEVVQADRAAVVRRHQLPLVPRVQRPPPENCGKAARLGFWKMRREQCWSGCLWHARPCRSSAGSDAQEALRSLETSTRCTSVACVSGWQTMTAVWAGDAHGLASHANGQRMPRFKVARCTGNARGTRRYVGPGQLGGLGERMMTRHQLLPSRRSSEGMLVIDHAGCRNWQEAGMLQHTGQFSWRQ